MKPSGQTCDPISSIFLPHSCTTLQCCSVFTMYVYKANILRQNIYNYSVETIFSVKKKHNTIFQWFVDFSLQANLSKFLYQPGQNFIFWHRILQDYFKKKQGGLLKMASVCRLRLWGSSPSQLYILWWYFLNERLYSRGRVPYALCSKVPKKIYNIHT